MSKRSDKNLEQKPWKLLLWTAIAGLIFGLIGFGEVAEDWLRVTRNSFHQHKASGEIVVVKFDDSTLKEYGNWPWPRRMQAQLLDKLTAADAQAVIYDVNFSYPSNPLDDAQFAEAIARSKRVTLAARFKEGADNDRRDNSVNGSPLAIFSAHAKIAALSLRYNYQN
ncbi:MAG TPA: CHASE2 domain-containing protein, partial [Sphingomicrobium sp.]|nr:CHASE2 domain-containing protein [Sphingomicrobium sp.]